MVKVSSRGPSEALWRSVSNFGEKFRKKKKNETFLLTSRYINVAATFDAGKDKKQSTGWRVNPIY